MTGKTETRVREIRSRTRQYRRQHENRVLFSLAAFSLFLLAGIGGVFKSAQTPGIAAVADGYGAVMYVVIGIAAFVVGVSVTVLCIRLKNRSANRTDHTEGSDY